MESIEKRYIPIEDAEVRVKKEGSRKVVGRGIVFNSWSTDLGGFIERIKPSAVDESLLTNPDLIATFQHNMEKIMGRVGAGTLRLTKTTRGVNYEFQAPNTTAGNDLLESVSRGDIKGSSFVFRVPKGGWEHRMNDEGLVERTVTQISLIREMGPVVGEAYEGTSVSKRTKGEVSEWKEEHQEVETISFDTIKHELYRKRLTMN